MKDLVSLLPRARRVACLGLRRRRCYKRKRGIWEELEELRLSPKAKEEGSKQQKRNVGGSEGLLVLRNR